MKVKTLLAAALLISLAPSPAGAGSDVQADVVVHAQRAEPTHALRETRRVLIPYGTGPDSLAFTPASHEREAVGPSAFDVDTQGDYVVADPVQRVFVRVAIGAGGSKITHVAPLPLPSGELAVDRDGVFYVMDVRSRALVAVTPGNIRRTPMARGAARFLRQGEDVLVAVRGGSHRVEHGGLKAFDPAMVVEKCNAEAALITVGPGGRRIQVEIGGPLASMQLLGVSGTGDIFLLVERFRQRRAIAVDREVLVLDGTGGMKARMPLRDRPVVHPAREFVLDARGKLHQMVPGDRGVTFVRWEVRP